MKVSEFSVKHPAVIGMLLIVLLVFGVLSISTTNIEFMGDLSMPSIIVISVYPGASAEDVEEDVTKILEDNFVTLPDFKSVTSESSNSVSVITVTFRDGIDPYDRLTEVRDRVRNLMDDLPDGLSGVPNAVVGGSSMLPIFTFEVNGGKDAGTVTDYIENTLRPRLTAIPGVSDVTVTGAHHVRVNVMLRLDDLAARNISVATVYQILNSSNVTLPAGTVVFEGRNIAMRYSGELASLDDIRDLPVGVAENKIIHLGDVADITLSYPEKTSYVTDGSESVIIVDVMKRSDGNTMSITGEAKRILAASELETGGAIRYDIISDDSRTVSASLSTVIRSGIIGIVMAVIVILLFLNDARTTIIIGFSIPLSIMFTFIGMKLSGISLNLMSLSGIVVALGMIVDGSIVMIEEVFRHYSAKTSYGKPLHSVTESILLGSSEVGSSIFASTATTIVVFVPVAMLSGIVGLILKDVALTLIMAIGSSFISAVVVVPFLMKMLLKEGGQAKHKASIIERGMKKLEEKYRRMLEWSLSSWSFIIFLSLCIMAASFFVAQSVGVAFIPSTDNGDFYIDVEFPSGYPLDDTHRQMQRINNILRENVSEVESAVFYSGQSQAFGGDSGAPSNKGYAHVILVPVSKRERNIREIILQMQNIISKEIPGVTVNVSNGGFDKLLGYVSGGGGFGVTLVSEDLQTLYDTASQVADFMRGDPDVVTVSVDTSFDTETLVIDMAHEYMNSLGITSYEAGVTSTILFRGMDAGRFRNKDDGERYDIRLYSNLTNKKVTRDDIENIQIVTQSGTPVIFANISDVHTEKAISQINHSNREKTITVTASLVGDDTTGLNARVQSYFADNPLPPGVSRKAGGIMELIEDAIPALLSALLIAVFLVYTIMVLQFERFRQPLIIMATIPFCLIGVILGLLMFGSTLSLLALLGVISLGGVVVNNGIILIDFINLIRTRRQDEYEKTNAQTAQQAATAQKKHIETEENLRQCVTEGAASRLRPIFMTTLTTMLGVVPMAIARGEGSEIYAPLGQAIAGGLLTSTLITLFIIPVLYYITERRKLRKSQKKAKRIHAALLIFLLVGNLHSQENYTFDKLSKMMEENSPTLRIAQEEYVRALLDAKDAKAGYGPDVSFTLGGGYSKSPLNELEIEAGKFQVTTPESAMPLVPGMPPIKIPSQQINFPDETTSFSMMSNYPYQISLDMTQPIFTWGKVHNANKLYSAAAEARRLQFEFTRKQMNTQLEATLAAIYFLTQMEEQLDAQLEHVERLVEFSEAAESSGMILHQDVLKVKLQASEIPILKKEIQNQKKSLLTELCRMTGISQLSENQISFVPNETAYTAVAEIDYDTLEKAALDETRQENLAALDQMTLISGYAKKIADGSVYWKPDIALQASVGINGGIDKLFKGESKIDKDFSASVSIGIKTTIWDGGKKLNDIKRQASNAETARLNKEEARTKIIQELQNQYDALSLSAARIAYYETKSEIATMDINRAQLRLDVGYASESDVLNARIDYATAQIQLMQEKINRATSACTIKLLTGI